MKKITKILVGGVAALALGGSVVGAALASGSSSEPTSTVDTDNIQLQQGDQTSPDTSATSTTSEPTSTVDTDNVQQGDQTSPDTSATSSTSEPTSTVDTDNIQLQQGPQTGGSDSSGSGGSGNGNGQG